MTDDLEDDADGKLPGSPPAPECPTCGTPVMLVTVSDPTIGVATPCGCRVRPDLLESE